MIYDISFEDELGIQGTISIFNSGYLASKLQEGSRYIIVGKPAFKYGKIIFSHPDIVPSSDSGELSGKLQFWENFPGLLGDEWDQTLTIRQENPRTSQSDSKLFF